LLGKAATRELWNYQLFVVAGAVMAWHYQAVHGWLCRHWRALLAATVVAVAFGEMWYVLATRGVPGFGGGDPSDPFQPAEIPLYMGLITMVYLLGVLMTSERLPVRLRSLVRAGADYSYGVYLSQVLVLTVLAALGWQSLGHYLPWEVVTAGAIVVVFVAANLLTALLARLPGARGTAGIPRRGWRTTNGGSDGGR
jgi:peptidoglycan/LPS O-acetylase OafA/YrhL